MRYHALPLALILIMIAMSAAAETRISLYSGDFNAVSSQSPSENMPGLAQIRQDFSRELPRGSSTISLDRLPIAIDVGSVQLTPASSGLRITSQRYDFSLIGQDQLLQQAVGQRVVVEQASASETARRYTGTLLAAGNGLTLLQDDGKVRVLANYSTFELEQMPDNLSARPTLRWTIDNPRSGRDNFQLDYATGGMAWQAEYQILLDGAAQTGKMMLSAAAQVVNRSGLDYPDAKLTLVAGTPNQVRSSSPYSGMLAAPAMRMMAKDSYDAGIEAQDMAEYHAYPLRNPVDLPSGSMQRVSLLDRTQNIPYKRHYDVGTTQAGYRPSHPQVEEVDGTQKLPVAITLEFRNDKADGLGIPLPAGRVRVFQSDSDNDSLLGEASLAHTASGQEVRMALGQAFDLSAQRKYSEHQLAADRLSLTETIEVTLSNAKKQTVAVRLYESLPRWRDWEIIDHSHDWRRVNAQTIAFDITVPAGKETTVRYRARYRWPADVRP